MMRRNLSSVSMSVHVLLGGVLFVFVSGVSGCSDPPSNSGTGAGGMGGSGGSGGIGGEGNGSSGGMGGAGAGGGGGMGSGGSSVGGFGGSAGAGGSGGGGPMNVCGNGLVEPPEVCDDGNTSSGDYCSADCTSMIGSCGDGMLQSNETCDDGTISTGCDTMQNGGDGKCLPAGMCSSGYVNVPGKGCQPVLVTDHVHIMVDNFCNMTVMPMEYTVAAGQKLKLSYHNHSADYPVDVWKSYGGGYTDLQPGMTWNETYEHCFGPAASEEYADISTACSQFQLKIHCL